MVQIQQRRRLLAQGYTDAEIQSRVRRGDLVTVRRGAYVAPGEVPDRPETRHALNVRAAWPHLARDAVVSHVSAAALYGLPLWGLPVTRVHVTRARPHGGRIARRLHVHAASIDPDEVDLLDGVTVTRPGRLVTDIARSSPFEMAVAVADAALNRGLVTSAELAGSVERAQGRPGVNAARRVVRFADVGSASVGESRSRVRMHAAGLPRPALQRPVETRISTFYVDFAWERWRVVGEFDGLVKYSGLLRPGRSATSALVEEKIREDAIRDEGWRVLRWIWTELDPFDGVAQRLARHLG